MLSRQSNRPAVVVPQDAHWQVQQAKQRFSEVLRAVETEGPQTITRHGEAVAVIIDISEYRRLTTPKQDLKELLRRPPYFDDTMIEIMERIEAERKKDFPRSIDLEIELGLVDDPRAEDQR